MSAHQSSPLWPIDPIRYAWESLNSTPLPPALWLYGETS